MIFVGRSSSTTSSFIRTMSSGSLECLYWLRNPRCSVRCRHLRILVAVICYLYADDSGSNESMPTYTMHLCISCGIIILFVGFAHQTLEYSKSSKFATHQNIPWKVFELCAREEQGLNRYLEDVLVIQLSNNSDGDLKIMMRICEDDHDEVDFAMPEWSSSRDSPWTSSWSWRVLKYGDPITWLCNSCVSLTLFPA